MSIFITKQATFITLLNPFAPHATEELWEMAKFDGMLNQTQWPKYDEDKCKESTIEIAVQVNGKVKTRINIDVDADEATVLDLAISDEKVKAAIGEMNIVKKIYIKGKLVNIVVKP